MSEQGSTAAEARTRVLYIAGLGKSGSTILSMILGQIPGFVAVGELRSFWKRESLISGLCSCGRPYAECPFWSKVTQDAFPEGLRVESARLDQTSWRLVRPRHLLLYALPGGWPMMRRNLGEYRDHVRAVYRAVAEQAGTRVIVDESKTPVHASLLAELAPMELFVLHLVRDPRAAAFSWSHERHAKRAPTEPPFMPVRVSKAALIWQITNVLIERKFGGRSGRYARVRYEDFVRAPQDTIRAALALLGEENARLPFTSDTDVVIAQTHLLSGNRAARGGTGHIAIRADEEWRVGMSRRDKIVATVLSLPMLFRYGYRLRG